MDGRLAKLAPWGVALVATVVFLQLGLEERLLRDDALYAYSGQRLAVSGVLPYASVFDHKGPIGSFVAGGAAWVGLHTGAGTLVAIRVGFLLVSALTVAMTFVVGRTLLRSPWSAALAAAFLTASWGFARHAASGPHPKSLMLLFSLLALWEAGRRRWFRAGLWGALSGLVWQPMGVYAAAACALAAAGEREGRWRRLGAALGGSALPFLLLLAVYAAQGQASLLLDGLLVFNMVDFTPEVFGEGTWPLRALRTADGAVASGFGALRPLMYLGLAAWPFIAWQAVRRHGSLGRALVQEPSAALWLTLPAPIAWSTLDFQAYPDWFPFLPYCALGCGWIFDRLRRPHLTACVIAVLLVYGVATLRSHRARGLVEQRRWAEGISARAGPEGRVLGLGVPQYFALTERENLTQFGYVMRCTDRYIARTVPGGLEGWGRSLREARPRVVLVMSIAPETWPVLGPWLTERFAPEMVGPWPCFVARDADPEEP